MASDTTQAEHHHDPRHGTAVIAPVTDEMMDHAAHEAAALADGVAHHTITRDEPAPPEVAADATSPSASTTLAVEPVADVAERTVDAAHGVASDAVERTVDATTRIAEEATAGVDRMAEAVRDASSASADALGRYNATLLEMMRANAASTTAHLAALVQAKSVPEAFSLNADHLRRQVDTLTTQGRELATLAQRIAFDAFKPFKGSTER